MLNEQLSAWCDGELSEEEFEGRSACYPLSDDQQTACVSSWLIGDVLRGDPVLSVDFTSRVMTALQSEPIVLAPGATSIRKRTSRIASQWMPIAAAVSGVLVAGWMVISVWSGQGEGALVASAPGISPTRSARVQQGGAVLVADKAYLMAHQASSVGAPMADVVHFIRTVSDDQQDQGK